MPRYECQRPPQSPRAKCAHCGHVDTYPTDWNLNRQGKCKACGKSGRYLKRIPESEARA